MKSVLVFTVEPCSVLNAIVSALNGSLTDVVVNIHRWGMCRLGAERENGDFINQWWANCSVVSCQEVGRVGGWDGGGFLQEKNTKPLLYFEILLLQHGSRERLCLKCKYMLLLPCVLMHELLPNLAFTISDSEIQTGKDHSCYLGQAVLCALFVTGERSTYRHIKLRCYILSIRLFVYLSVI